MNTKLLSLLVVLASASWITAQTRQPKPAAPPPPPPPPVSTVQPAAPSPEKYVYDHKASSERPFLVTPEQAQTIITRFKEVYGKMGNPRVLIYINRELVDDDAGMKLSARSEQTETVRGQVHKAGQADAAGAAGSAKSTNASAAIVSGDLKTALAATASDSGNVSGQIEKVTSKNTYRVRDRKQAALADRQTMRDVERLFGRPLRMAGVSLVDQAVAVQLIGDKPLTQFTVPTEGESARKDRDALAKIADVVLEILVSSRQLTIPDASGDKVYATPDIQATAIRLKDAKIVGQASAADLIGHTQGAAKLARNFGVREISEATALALMEDMTQWP